MAKEDVAHTFFIGMFAVARQSIFINRESMEDRNHVIDLIKKRSDLIKHNEHIAPLLIFPEGTVSNGRTLMTFKRGAFLTGDLLKIYTLKYNADGC